MVDNASVGRGRERARAREGAVPGTSVVPPGTSGSGCGCGAGLPCAPSVSRSSFVPGGSCWCWELEDGLLIDE